MSKHTPGPWTFTSEQISDDGVQIHDEIRCFHLQSGDTVVLDGCGCCDSPRLGNPADARLIAAAPELLEALEQTLQLAIDWEDEARGTWQDEALGFSHNDDPIIKKARAAIAKAKGEV